MSYVMKPCPFCGSRTALAVLTEGEIDGFDEGGDRLKAVMCQEQFGGCGARGPYRTTKTAALAGWNRRHG